MTEREIFTTSRLSEFTSVKGLTTATGHGPQEWPLVVLKELVDNGIDAAERAGIPPAITITVADNAITVTDNGLGIDTVMVSNIINYSTRTSSNEAYVSPTRGQQGNALQTILAMPFALDGKRGESIIESRGIKHIVVFEVDAIRRTPKASLETKQSPIEGGTRIAVQWPVCASIQLQETKPRFVQIAEDYATFNPHLSITLKWDGRTEVDIKPADPVWPKWLPRDLTSAHWYSTERFNTLIAATIAKDQDKGRDTLVREFIANTFPGMARSASQKIVLDKIDAARMPLATLFNEGKNRSVVASLLSALKAETKLTKPVDLGIIGRVQMESRCIDAGADTEHFNFNYHKALGLTDDGLPWIVEAAFAYCPKAKPTDDTGDDDIGDADDDDDVENDDNSEYRRLIAGCNWSPGIGDPFRIDTLLAEQRVDADATKPDRVVVMVHLTCPVLPFTDRGKSTLALPYEIREAVNTVVVKVTAKWAKQVKAEERDNNARWQREERMRKSGKVTLIDAVYGELPAAYDTISEAGTLPVNARQLYYAIRNAVKLMTGRELRSVYLTQTLIPKYIAENGVDWNVVYDDRGHLTEPHTRKVVGIGTLSVRKYLHERKSPQAVEADLRDAHVETNGADGNYGAILYIEKEGFDSLIDSMNLRERFDIAIMSCKGMSVTSARSLVEAICGSRGIPLFVLHDFDKAGLSIAATMGRDTVRYQFEHKVKPIDLGLRMDDINRLNLRQFAEPRAMDKGSIEKRSANMRLNGATDEEIGFLINHRIELNAMTSRQFVDLIERGLTGNGIGKLVPGAKLLNNTYRAMIRNETIRIAFEDAVEEAIEEAQGIAIPATLRQQVEAYLKKHPASRWDQAVAEIARKA